MKKYVVIAKAQEGSEAYKNGQKAIVWGVYSTKKMAVATAEGLKLTGIESEIKAK